jgi:AraC-like DNA-binding protein
METALFESAVAFVGQFRCSVNDPFFKDSGPIRNHIVVFPHTPVEIRHEGHDPFVATTQHVTLYNRGQRYRRRAVAPGVGDYCDFIAVREDVLAPIAEGCGGPVDPERPFSRQVTAIPAATFIEERSLIGLLASDRCEVFELEERIVNLVTGALKSIRARHEWLPKSSRERVELAKALLASDLERNVSVQDIACQAETSLFHLCTLFRRDVGMTMHQFRMRLRLNLAYDELLRGGDILATAVRTGFSSHSHFTYAFRRYFGIPPSKAIAVRPWHRVPARRRFAPPRTPSLPGRPNAIL